MVGRTPWWLIDQSEMRCTVCNAPVKTGCECWVRCSCGWYYRNKPGTKCRNPIHSSGVDVTRANDQLNLHSALDRLREVLRNG